MSTVDHPPLYDELIDLLAKSAQADEVLSFQLSSEKQHRLDDLLARNREGTLTPSESAELDSFEQFEHLVRLLKSRVVEVATARGNYVGKPAGEAVPHRVTPQQRVRNELPTIVVNGSAPTIDSHKVRQTIEEEGF